MWCLWCCILLVLLEVNRASDKLTPCAEIDCEHDDVNVCGIRSGSKEVAFRWFRDECALRKSVCDESETTGFRSVGIEYCIQAFGNDPAADGANIEQVEVEVQNVDSTFSVTEKTDISANHKCIRCNCDIKSEAICAIRAEDSRFIIRRFADECHMMQFNCENNMNFTVTDDYICLEDIMSTGNHVVADKSSKIAREIENVELFYETGNVNEVANQKCIQTQCIPSKNVICAVRQEDKHFIIRWFSDKCEMLQYNCDKQFNFIVTEDSLCTGVDSLYQNHTGLVGTQTMDSDITIEVKNAKESFEISDGMDTTGTKTISKEEVDYDTIPEEIDTIDLLQTTNDIQTTVAMVSTKEEHKFEKQTHNNGTFPNNIVVTTFDMNEDINKTAEKFFAASHTFGIPIQKVDGVETRRMLIKDTGPVNLFVPRAFIPANYTPPENRNESKQYPEYSPLVKYCYHKCPEKCPEFYKPVCGARIDNKKQTPFVFFKNHCYMDIAKCKMSWAGFKGYNYTELEEMGFVFCGGYKMMNMMYMYPLVKILQKMGRLKKKGKVHFVLRNMGQFPIPLQG